MTLHQAIETRIETTLVEGRELDYRDAGEMIIKLVEEVEYE